MNNISTDIYFDSLGIEEGSLLKCKMPLYINGSHMNTGDIIIVGDIKILDHKGHFAGFQLTLVRQESIIYVDAFDFYQKYKNGLCFEELN